MARSDASADSDVDCYLLVDDRTNRAVLVDPGSEGDRLVDAIDSSKAKLEAIWITHAHVDHVGAIASIKKRWDVPVYLHPLDRRLYEAAGIRVRGETRDLVFRNNIIRDTRSPEARKQTVGIRIEEPAGKVVLEGNEIDAKTQVEDRRK